MSLSSPLLVSKFDNVISVASRSNLNYQLLLVWIVFVSWSVGYGLEEPLNSLNYTAIKGDEDRFGCASEETNRPGCCYDAPLDGECVTENMRDRLYSVDEPVKNDFDQFFTSPESISRRYLFGSVEATLTAERVVLGIIILLTLSVIGTVKSTKQFGSTSERNFTRKISSCPTVKGMRQSSVHCITKSSNVISVENRNILGSRQLLWIALVICSIAVFPQSVHGLVTTESGYKIVSIGDGVELKCFFNTSSPLEWYFAPHGSNESEFVNESSQADSNGYSIVRDASGHANLIIDPVRKEHAGRYECRDADEMFKLTMETTVLNPNPVCDQSPESSSVVCRLLYYGSKTPDFKWMKSGNTTFCNESAIGSLRITDYMSPAERWRCMPHEYDGHSREALSVPLNWAGVKGQEVRLNCLKQKDHTGFWFRNVPLSADDILIFHRKIVNTGWFSVDSSVPGRSDLLFLSLESTSGRFGCDSVEDTRSAEVVVLDPQPTCSKKIKNGVVNVSCSIGFSGNWPPVIDWTDSTGILETNDKLTIPNHRVTSSLNVPLSKDTPHNLHSIACSVRFKEEDKPSQTTASNIPEIFLYTCKIIIEESDYKDTADEIVILGSIESAEYEEVMAVGLGQTESSALLSDSVDGNLQTESRYRIVLLGDKVEFDCFVNPSSQSEWYFTPHGSNTSKYINSSSQANSSDPDAFKIVSEDSGHTTLVIDNVLNAHAGRYDCIDTIEKYRLSLEVTVVDPNPVCNNNPESSSIDCPFQYVGNNIPDFVWLTSENVTFCNEFVNDSSTIGSVRMNDYKNTSERCKPQTDDEHSPGKTHSPLNHAAVKGEEIRLNCSTQNDDTRYWFRNAPQSADSVLVYHKSLIRNNRFVVDNAVPGRSDLSFTSSESASGRFGCDSVGGAYTAEVVMIDQQPSCSSATKNDIVNVSCSIGFRGDWHPVMEWYDILGLVKTNYTIGVTSHRVTSFLIIRLTGDPNELYFVTCLVKFRIKDKPSKTTATNIPSIVRNTCGVTIISPDHEDAPVAVDGSTSATESLEHGEAAGGIDVDQAEDIGSGPAAGDKGVRKWNNGMAAEEAAATDKPKSNSGNGQGIVVFLQLHLLAFVAAYAGSSQF